MRHFLIILIHCAYSTRRKTRWLYKTKGKGQMQLQVSCLDQELSSGRQAAGIQTALLVSNPWSSDKCPTVHPFKDGLLDLDALCLLYWISSSALIHQGLLCYILKSNLGAALDTKRKFPKFSNFHFQMRRINVHYLKFYKECLIFKLTKYLNFGDKNDVYDLWYFFRIATFCGFGNFAIYLNFRAKIDTKMIHSYLILAPKKIIYDFSYFYHLC